MDATRLRLFAGASGWDAFCARNTIAPDIGPIFLAFKTLPSEASTPIYVDCLQIVKRYCRTSSRLTSL